jgi:hypothetical protein
VPPRKLLPETPIVTVAPEAPVISNSFCTTRPGPVVPETPICTLESLPLPSCMLTRPVPPVANPVESKVVTRACGGM